MVAPTQVNWETLALLYEEEATRRCNGLPVLWVCDLATGEIFDVSATPEGKVRGYREGISCLFSRGFARDWFFEVLEIRRLHLQSEQLRRRT
jgi:hypothetical protein